MPSRTILRLGAVFGIAALAAAAAGPVAAQTAEPAPEAEPRPAPRTSLCQAFAQRPSPLPIRRASFVDGLEDGQVGLTFVTHATFLIETPKGVTIATDFAGYAGPGVIPKVVTMNGAHSTHFTMTPDPRIETVLRGWGEKEQPVGHDVVIEDVRIRTVSTDVLRWSGGLEKNGNSIFVFEVGDLCIGHLGHIHHVPTAAQFGEIGFLDIVMAPVDGGYTLPLDDMVTVLRSLRAKMVIPMHFFGQATLERFLTAISEEFPVERRDGASLIVDRKSLPARPTVVVMPPYSSPSYE